MSGALREERPFGFPARGGASWHAWQMSWEELRYTPCSTQVQHPPTHLEAPPVVSGPPRKRWPPRVRPSAFSPPPPPRTPLHHNAPLLILLVLLVLTVVHSDSSVISLLLIHPVVILLNCPHLRDFHFRDNNGAAPHRIPAKYASPPPRPGVLGPCFSIA